MTTDKNLRTEIMRIPQIKPARIGRVMNITAYRISKKTAPISNKLLHTAEKTINRKVLPGVFILAEAFMHPVQIHEMQRINVAKNIIASSGDSFTKFVVPNLEHAAKNPSIKKIKMSASNAVSNLLDGAYNKSADEMNIIISSLVYKKGTDVAKNPLYGKGEVFIEKGEKYGVNPAVLASIAMFESGRGTSYAARVKKNVGGIMGRKSLRTFASVDDCIDVMAKTLQTRKNENIKDVYQLGLSGKYCDKSVGSEWAKNVMVFLNKF